jgi:hypothetical protein
MSANDRQEGGKHYAVGGKPQHWDLVTMYEWDYFQAQITKYLMRWKTKHPTHATRLIDLQKARHFLDKYIEEARQWDHRLDPDQTPAPEPRHLGLSNDANSDEYFQCEAYIGSGYQHYKCRTCGESVLAHSLSKALEEHGSCPGRGYVNQG